MKENRDCIVNFRLTSAQVARYSRLAALRGVSMSRLVRGLLAKDFESALLGQEQELPVERPAVVPVQIPATFGVFDVAIQLPVALQDANDRMAE